MKQWSELNSIEKHALREYESWCKSNCEEALKCEMAIFWIKRITELHLLHLVQ